MNSQILKGNWKQLKGRIQQRWGQLNGNDLDEFEGSFDELVGMIQERTGETRESIEHFVADFSNASPDELRHEPSAFDHLTDQATAYAQRAACAVRDTTDQAGERLRETYEDAEAAVRKHPLESLAMTFAAGLVLGIGATLVLRSK